MELTLSSPLLKRLSAWSQERFPAVNIFSAYLTYFLVAIVVRAFSGEQKYFDLLKDLSGGGIVALHFFLLRILDEHKDYKSDLINYPERILSKGLVTLSLLRKIGIYAFVVQLGLVVNFISQGNNIILPIALVYIWTGLMTVEFFCRQWLRSHFVVYSFLHLLMSPLLVYLCALIVKPEMNNILVVGLLMLMSFCGGLFYEIARKTKGPEEETTEESFSKLFGYKKSVLAMIVITLVLLGAGIDLAQIMGFKSYWMYIAAILSLLLTLLQVQQFLKSPSKMMRKKNEGVGALVSMCAFSFPIIAGFFK